MERRKWVPDVAMIADQVIADYRNATKKGEAPLDVIGTMASWIDAAREHGEEFTENDWIAPVQELAWRASGTSPAR